MKGIMRYHNTVALLGALLVTVPQIAAGANSAAMTIKVTVLAPPPCIINGNQPIEVDFGDVLTTDVDSGKYRQPINYTLECRDVPQFTAIKIQILGNSTAFDSTALLTSQNGLGIFLFNGSQTSVLNKPLPAFVGLLIPVEAKLVKQPGVSLTAGEFTAGATMKVDYR